MDVAQTTLLISDYGVYATVAILLSVVMFLYKRVNTLEADMRKFLSDHIESRAMLTAETSAALKESTCAINKSTEAMRQNSETLKCLSAATDNFGHITHILKELIDRIDKR